MTARRSTRAQIGGYGMNPWSFEDTLVIVGAAVALILLVAVCVASAVITQGQYS